MNKDDIKKALEVCTDCYSTCDDCPYDDVGNCGDTLKTDACELIVEQENEIERLKAENETYCKQINQAYDTGYDDGYKSCNSSAVKGIVKRYDFISALAVLVKAVLTGNFDCTFVSLCTAVAKADL